MKNFQILFETTYTFNFPSYKIIPKSFKDYSNWSHAWIQSHTDFELLVLYYKVIFELRHSYMPERVRPFQDLSGKANLVFLDPPSPKLFTLQVYPF